MDAYRLDLSSPPGWRPLEQLSKLLADSNSPISIHPGDFMYMGQLVSLTCPAIQLYKHRLTRAYLCLDPCGHNYAVTMQPDHIEVTIQTLVDCAAISERWY